MSRNSMQLNLPPAELEKVQKPTDRCLKSLQAWKDLFVRATQRAGLSQKATASALGISEQQYSNQLAYDGDARRDHISFWRMHKLPPEFWREVIALMCEYHEIVVGHTVQERTDCEIGKLIREAVGKVIAR